MTLPDPADTLQDNPAPMLRRVLLVAGFSGSGKTTFLTHLAAGTLPPAIRAELPAGCEHWHQVEAWKLVEFLQLNADAGEVDIVLHYDTCRPVRMRRPGFGDDVPIQIVAKAATITALTLRPTGDQLWRQLGRREFKGNSPEETRDAVRSRAMQLGPIEARRAAPPLQAAIMGLVRRLAGHGPAEPPRPARPREWCEILGSYEQPDFLSFWMRRWEDFLASLAAQGRLIREISIVPVGDTYAEQDRRWALLESADKT